MNIINKEYISIFIKIIKYLIWVQTSHTHLGRSATARLWTISLNSFLCFRYILIHNFFIHFIKIRVSLLCNRKLRNRGFYPRLHLGGLVIIVCVALTLCRAHNGRIYLFGWVLFRRFWVTFLTFFVFLCWFFLFLVLMLLFWLFLLGNLPWNKRHTIGSW